MQSSFKDYVELRFDESVETLPEHAPSDVVTTSGVPSEVRDPVLWKSKRVVDPREVKLLMAHAGVLTRVRHPNILAMRELRVDGTGMHAVAEDVEGVELSSLLGEAARRAGVARGLPLGVALRITADILDGLCALHEAFARASPRLIHGSLQPGAVIVGRDGRSRIARLGGASVDCVALPDAVPADGAYLAPEQWGADVVDERTDVFAVGAILWELIAGRRLFTGSREAILFKMIRGEVPAPGGSPRAAPDLFALCRRALEPRRAERFGSARAFATEVRRLGKGFAIPMSDAVVAEYLDLPPSDERQAHNGAMRMVERSATRPPEGAPLATAASARTKMPFDNEDRTVAVEARAYSQLAADLFLGPSAAPSPALPVADDFRSGPRDRPTTPPPARPVTEVSEGLRAVPAECAPEIVSHTVRMVRPTVSLPQVAVGTTAPPEASSLDTWFQDEAVHPAAATGGTPSESGELRCGGDSSPAEIAGAPSTPPRVRSRVGWALLATTTIAALLISGIIPTAWFSNLVEAAKRARIPMSQPEVVATSRSAEPSLDVPALAAADPAPSPTAQAAMGPGASATVAPLPSNRPARGPTRPRPMKHGSTVASATPPASGSPPGAAPEVAPHPDRVSEVTEDPASRASAATHEP